MGKIKSKAVKALARDIKDEHGEKFTTSFEKNKKIISKVWSIDSKKIKNVVTGCITRENVQKKKNSK